MVKCEDCEKVFREEDLVKYEECMGEYWGAPAYETYYKCPYCGSTDYYEVTECIRCGEWTDNGEYCEICEDDLFG